MTRLFRNTTTEWLKLNWVEGGELHELVATPGHHMLDRFGQFPRLDEMVRNGSAEVVPASGHVVKVTAERIVYSLATAHLFEQAQHRAVAQGNVALAPQALQAWATTTSKSKPFTPMWRPMTTGPPTTVMLRNADNLEQHPELSTP